MATPLDSDESQLSPFWRNFRIVGLVIGLALVGLIIYLITCTPFSTWVFGLGKGDANYAAQWREKLAPLASPAAAKAAYPNAIEVLEFGNGEWIIGVAADSHASSRGGTVVVRDSAGATHAYFGHVCGPGFLWRVREAKTLRECYNHREWSSWEMQEHLLPHAPP